MMRVDEEKESGTDVLGKEALAWLIVRGFGLYFLLKAIGALVFLLPILWGALTHFHSLELQSYWHTFSLTFPLTFLIALYLLRRGQFVHRLLMHVTPSAQWQFIWQEASEPKSEKPDSFFFSDEERDRFNAWLEKFPERKSDSFVDQLARFRGEERGNQSGK